MALALLLFSAQPAARRTVAVSSVRARGHLDARLSLARLAKDDDIEIRIVSLVTRVSRDDYSIIAQPVPEATLEAYAPLFERAWRRYPASLMAKVGLKRIVLGANVRVEGQPRAIVPEFGPGWLWVDAAVGAKNPEYGCRALDHDWFHMIDRSMNPGANGGDLAWAALNSAGFRYGVGGWWMQTKGVGALHADLPGFVTAYSTAAVEEDKAELFSHLIDDPAFVAGRAAADPVLRAKIERLKATVTAFDPTIDAAWWPRP